MEKGQCRSKIYIYKISIISPPVIHTHTHTHTQNEIKGTHTQNEIKGINRAKLDQDLKIFFLMYNKKLQMIPTVHFMDTPD